MIRMMSAWRRGRVPAALAAAIVVLGACANTTEDNFRRVQPGPQVSAAPTTPVTTQPLPSGPTGARPPSTQPTSTQPTTNQGTRVLGTLETATSPTGIQPAGTAPNAQVGVATAVPAQPSVLVSIAPPADIPASKGDVLADSIDVALQNYGVRPVAFGDPTATLLVRTRLAAVPTGPQTMIVYNTEIVSASGQTVHQFGGQDLVTQVTPDGWSAVDNATLDRIGAAIAAGVAAYLPRS
ncbi:MAG: hypothetical protein KDI98_08940 [Hyphomicrobiaceae bacterium]|nr:hypothetical protein [Hyphomicrobiaceae bacterium]